MRVGLCLEGLESMGQPNFKLPEPAETYQIFYGEFDGRRPKRVLVKIIGEEDDSPVNRMPSACGANPAH